MKTNTVCRSVALIPTFSDVLKGFIAFVKTHVFPLVGFVQVCGGDDGQSHTNHVLLATAPRLLDETPHRGSTDGLLYKHTQLLSTYTQSHTHKEHTQI